MTCNEFDELRDKGRGTGAALPPSAQEHLRSCERCRKLQTCWESSDEMETVPEALQARITENIVTALEPVSPLSSDSGLVASLLLLVSVAVAIGTMWLGHQGWQALALWQAATVFGLLIGSTVLMAYVVIRQMVPGALQRMEPKLAMSAVFVSILTAVLLLFPYHSSSKFISAGIFCLERGLLTAAGAAVLFYSVLRRGEWLSPVKLWSATGCLSGLTGLIVSEIYCSNLDRGHIAVWHLGAAVTATLIGGVAAAAGLRVRDRSRMGSS